jgi:hypothetical protein
MAKKSVEELTEELFVAVEADQGSFCFSDAYNYEPAEFWAMVRGRLKAGERAVKKTRAFLRKYGEI